MPDDPLQSLTYLAFFYLAMIGAMRVLVKLADWAMNIEKEAKERGKRIELGLLIMSIAAFCISALSLVVSLYALEQSSK